MPASYLIVNAAPGFTIIEASELYLHNTQQDRSIIGKPLFEAFPDNPANPHANGVRNLTESLHLVLKTGRPHAMDIQRYDTRIPGTSRFVEHYWKPLNIPIKNNKGVVEYILHTVENITEQFLLGRKLKQLDQHTSSEIENAVSAYKESESKELSRELHDNVNQLLITAKMYLGRALDKNDVDRNMAGKGLGLISDAIREIKKISEALVSTSQREIHLEESMNTLMGQVGAYDGFKIAYIKNFPGEDLVSQEVKRSILRITQEQITNIIKHAQARNIYVSIDHNDELLKLKIEDDGKGFDLDSMEPGLGYVNIRNRVLVAGGSFKINTAPGSGCKLEVIIPFRN